MMNNNHTFRNLAHLVALVVVTTLGSLSPVSAKRNDDVVFLKNGDRLTGEIKGLQRGEFKFKADYMKDAVILDWARVDRIESKSKFLVSLIDGKLFTDFVRLAPAASTETENFVIGMPDHAVRVRQLEVLRITPIESGFWRQLEGNIDFGFNFTSGNSQYQVELQSSATYRMQGQSVTARVDNVFSGQPKGSSTARSQFTIDYERQLTPRWYAGGLLDFLHSDQQSLNLRTTMGGLLGRRIRQTERTRFSLFGGMAATREHYSANLGKPQTTNADAIAGLDFSTVRFKTTDITSRLSFYPSVTTPGRTRIQATSDMRIEIAKDLYLGFHVYENFDSKPPVRAAKNDLGISTSLGWKF